MIKQPGGVLLPVSDMELEKLNRFKTGEQYSIEIKLTRNPAFHRKVFAFFNFCFKYWKCDKEFQSETRQFDVFRNNLTVIAGFYDQYVSIHGEVRVEAKSLSFSSMTQEEFEECYNALVNAAMKHVFKTADDNTYNQLLSFF
jgi:hypothetical protein